MYSFVSTGAGCVIENSCVLVEPAELVTWMTGAPVAAPAAMLKVAVSVVPTGSVVTLVKVRPLHAVDRVAPVRLLPIIVMGTDAPCAALEGLMPVIDGGTLFVTGKLNVVCPPAAVSVIGAVPIQAFDAILNVA